MTTGNSKTPRGGIKIDDAEAIKARLHEVNGRATNFVLTASELKTIATNAESSLDAARLPQALRVGVTLRYRTAGPWAKAYKYSATGNAAELKRFREGWRLVSVEKVLVYPRQKESFKLLIDEHCAGEIKRRSVEDFEVREPAKSTSNPEDRIALSVTSSIGVEPHSFQAAEEQAMTAVNRASAQSVSAIGCVNRDLTATWKYLPSDVVGALPLPVFAELIDNFWASADKNEALAKLETILGQRREPSSPDHGVDELRSAKPSGVEQDPIQSA